MSVRALPMPRRLDGSVVALLLTTPIVTLLALEIPAVIADFAAHPAAISGDFYLYLERTRSFLAGQGFYLDRQLHGPYQWVVGDAFYPPTAILLFAPFLVLPAVLWWVIPLGIIGWAVIRHRPAPWAWPLIAFGFAWPSTLYAIGFGNPTMWVVSAVALGTVYGWPAALVLLKPSLAPFALLGVRQRSWWIALGALGLVSLAFLPLWPQYVAVIRDGHLPLWYSVRDVPMMLIPVIAWAGRRRS